LLAVHHLRNGREPLAAGFLVFLAGETLIVSGSAMDLAASAPLFAAGAGLCAAALGLSSAAREFPVLVRATGAIAAVLFMLDQIAKVLSKCSNFTRSADTGQPALGEVSKIVSDVCPLNLARGEDNQIGLV
jgi:hypothetical protein